MSATPPVAPRLRVAHLNARAANEFSVSPDADQRKAIAEELELLDLPALEFVGDIRAQGADSWVLDGDLRATVVQPCAVTLAPVTSKIGDKVRRIYSPHLTQPEEDEVEMPDDEMEPLGQFIDLGAVMIEALALALPLYPRAKGVDLPEAEVAPEPDTRKPFAGLADLLKRDS